MGYRLTRKAAEDLRGIYATSPRDFGSAQAEAYQARLRRTLELLAENPRLGRERPEIDPPVRIQPCGAHVVVYLVEGEHEVLVVRLRHGRENWAAEPF